MTLFTGSAVFTAASAAFEPGTWLYDFFMSYGGDLGGAGFFVLGTRYLWEEKAEQSAPPETK